MLWDEVNYTDLDLFTAFYIFFSATFDLAEYFKFLFFKLRVFYSSESDEQLDEEDFLL